MESTLTKKSKLDDDLNAAGSSMLSEFEFVRVLNDNSANRLMIVEVVKNKEPGVVIFEKPQFSVNDTKELIMLRNPDEEIQLRNDIYNKFSLFPLKPYNSVQVQLIYPATQAHLAKYAQQEQFFLTESFDDWRTITSKYINESAFDLTWVYNILEHKTESERILLEDSDPNSGFILLPDMKWNLQVDTLYMLALVHKKGIESLRSLTSQDIPLLKNIRDKSLAAIEAKFGVKKSKIRVYLHYQPSFYHLHVHFAHINYCVPGVPERNFALNQVIENLTIDGDYYKKVSLDCVLKKNDKLFELYKDRFE